MSDQTGKPVQKWAYRTISIAAEFNGAFARSHIDFQLLNEELNRLGEQGWELVSVMDTNLVQGQTRDVVAFLKRPID